MRNGLSRIVLKTTMLPIEIVRIMAQRQSEGGALCCRIMKLAIGSIIQNDKGKTRRRLKALCT